MDPKQEAPQDSQTPPVSPSTTAATEQPTQPSTPPPSPETPSTTTETPTTPSPSPSTDVPASTTPISTPNPVAANTTSPIATPPKTKGKPKGMIVIVVVILLFIIIAGAYFFMTKQNNPKPMAMTQPAKQVTPTPIPPTNVPTPVISPVTTGNVDQTLNNSDATVQQASNQATTDVNSVSKINSTQDSTNGL